MEEKKHQRTDYKRMTDHSGSRNRTFPCFLDRLCETVLTLESIPRHGNPITPCHNIETGLRH